MQFKRIATNKRKSIVINQERESLPASSSQPLEEEENEEAQEEEEEDPEIVGQREEGARLEAEE